MFPGTILGAWRMSKGSFKRFELSFILYHKHGVYANFTCDKSFTSCRLFNIQWSILRSLRNLACHLPKEFFSMDLLVVVKPFLQKQLLMSAKPISLV